MTGIRNMINWDKTLKRVAYMFAVNLFVWMFVVDKTEWWRKFKYISSYCRLIPRDVLHRRDVFFTHVTVLIVYFCYCYIVTKLHLYFGVFIFIKILCFYKAIVSGMSLCWVLHMVNTDLWCPKSQNQTNMIWSCVRHTKAWSFSISESTIFVLCMK